jgi:hypothetical protein
MSVTVASWIVGLAVLYLSIGAAFAIPFALVGAGRIDPHAESGTIGFRLLILPGAAALWPLLLTRWLRADGGPREERSPHRLAARDEVPAKGALSPTRDGPPGAAL